MKPSYHSEDLLFIVGQLDRLEGYYLNFLFDKMGFPVTREQWIIIKYLWDRNGVSQQELANDLLKNKASITSLIENLEKREFVTRKTNAYDKRSKMVFLTEKGKNLRENINKLVQQTTGELTRGLDKDQLINAKEVLDKILNNLVFLKRKNMETLL